MHIQFPPKVSGFYKGDPPKVLSTIKIEQDLSVLQGLPIQSDWDFISLEDYPNYSYHLCRIQYGQSEYLFFINKYATIGALSEVAPNESLTQWEVGRELPRNTYTDWVEGTKLLGSKWEIIPPRLLVLSVDADNPTSQQIVANLQNEEFAQFSYWEPQNMGNILFNNWEKTEYWPLPKL